MNNIELTRFQGLSGFFTTDAWQLIESFLVNFQHKMSQLDISLDEQTSVTTGIVEFIEEFVENYKHKSKINYDETLNLVRDIGSPSEILQAMDVSFEQIFSQEAQNEQAIEKPILCKACNWSNDPDARFCDNCGKKLAITEGRLEDFFPYDFVQNSYIAIFCLSYLSLIILGILNIGYRFSPFMEPNLVKIPNLFTKLHSIATDMVIPSLILGLVFGYIIKRYYQDSFGKNYRHNLQLAHYRKYFSLGLVLSLIALWLFFIYSPLNVSRDEFITMTVILLILSFIFFIGLYRWNLRQEPTDIPYFVLIRSINSYENDVSKKLKNGNLIGGLILLVAVYSLWGDLMFWTVFGLPAWIAVYLSLLLLLNGIQLLFYFSWNQTARYLNR